MSEEDEYTELLLVMLLANVAPWVCCVVLVLGLRCAAAEKELKFVYSKLAR